jgi:hypothetical protein
MTTVDDFDFDAHIDDKPTLVSSKKPEEKKDAVDDNKDDKKEDDDDGFTFDLDDEDDKKDDVTKEEEKKEEKKPVKKTKEDSLADLRKQRDALNEENVKFKDIIGEADPAIIKQLKSFIDENFEGDIPTEDSVIAFLDDTKQLKEENEKLKKELSDREGKIKDLDIRSSAEFNEQYIKPLQNAAADLQVEISNIDANGEVLAPDATRAFHAYLMKQDKMDSMQMKKLLAKFSSDFEKETGQKYDAPSVSAAMSSYRSFKTHDAKMSQAYQNWENEKKNTIEKQSKLTQEQLAMQDKNNRDERKAGAIKALRSFDLNTLEGIHSKEELEKTVRATYQEMEGIIQDHSKLPTYDVTMQRAVKAKLYDEVIVKYNELLEWKKLQEEEDGDNSKDRGSRKAKSDGGDWLEGDF